MSSFARPEISVSELPKRGARQDFEVRAIGPGETDYTFPVSITWTALGMWQVEDGKNAALVLADALAISHGTARSFPEEGFWFDSYVIAETVEQTCNRIRSLGWETFLHPAARRSLGADLFRLLTDLDEVRMTKWGEPFMKPLDILFEPNQALEDLDSTADDHPHFIYRVCILGGIVDRFNFEDGPGKSLNGLKIWLTDLCGEDCASKLTQTYFMLRRLRRQYPIHEQYHVDAAGYKSRRSDVVEAEKYFGLDGSPSRDWRLVRQRFLEDTQRIRDFLRNQ